MFLCLIFALIRVFPGIALDLACANVQPGESGWLATKKNEKVVLSQVFPLDWRFSRFLGESPESKMQNSLKSQSLIPGHLLVYARTFNPAKADG